MIERKHITLIYQYNDKWIGGTYYILNVIRSLQYLEDSQKPFLTIIHDKSSSIDAIKIIEYPYINYQPFDFSYSLIERLINKISRQTIGRPLIKKKLPGKAIKNLYPVSDQIETSNVLKYYYWIPDLQEHYMPEMFQKDEVKARINMMKTIKRLNFPIVFSSHTALEDFNKFYPENTNLKKVIRFVSISSINLESLSSSDLKKKFNIKDKYIMTSNQFWAHKNHAVLLEAFNNLSKDYPYLQLVLTGKEYDHRNPTYTKDLKNYVKQNNLTEKILFLGFINRDEQLKLMSESEVIVQPSLFEGWSTVVEDAKLLNKYIICSNLAVHKEQLPGSDLFFDSQNPSALKQKLEDVLTGKVNFELKYDHNLAIKEFAKNFVNLF